MYFKDFSSGAMIENIVRRAKKLAIKRVIADGPQGHPHRGPHRLDPPGVQGARGPAQHHQPRRLGEDLGQEGRAHRLRPHAHQASTTTTSPRAAGRSSGSPPASTSRPLGSASRPPQRPATQQRAGGAAARPGPGGGAPTPCRRVCHTTSGVRRRWPTTTTAPTGGQGDPRGSAAPRSRPAPTIGPRLSRRGGAGSPRRLAAAPPAARAAGSVAGRRRC